MVINTLLYTHSTFCHWLLSMDTLVMWKLTHWQLLEQSQATKVLLFELVCYLMCCFKNDTRFLVGIWSEWDYRYGINI